MGTHQRLQSTISTRTPPSSGDLGRGCAAIVQGPQEVISLTRRPNFNGFTETPCSIFTWNASRPPVAASLRGDRLNCALFFSLSFSVAASFMQMLWVLIGLQVKRSRECPRREALFRKMNAEYVKSYFPAPFSGRTKCPHTNKRNLKCESDGPRHKEGT